ncbi:MAG: threonine synthase, partial [Clostridia bacterium]|nr:threonine synthase [Clostridia bacterium]
MLYTSTRDKSVKVESAYAIAQGISKDGGLFVPTEIPQIDKAFIDSLVPLSYIERAKKVLSLYLTDFTAEEIDMCVSGAYAEGKFSSDKVAPVKKIKEGENILELWRGPTCAFKDMALQLLPYLLTVSAKKTVADKTIVILVATSGDTGKAALEGFKDVPGTKIMVFYPDDGVSPMQKLQMTTQEGNNVGVCAIYGNFDDAQTGVKSIFTNKEILKRFEENN